MTDKTDIEKLLIKFTCKRSHKNMLHNLWSNGKNDINFEKYGHLERMAFYHRLLIVKLNCSLSKKVYTTKLYPGLDKFQYLAQW